MFTINHTFDTIQIIVARGEAVRHFAHDLIQDLAAHFLMRPVRDVGPTEELVIKDMGEGSVAQVVTQACKTETSVHLKEVNDLIGINHS